MTVVTVVVLVYGVVSPNGYGRALALGGATPVGAAVVVAGTGIPTFYTVALGAPIALGIAILRRHRDLEVAWRRPAPAAVPLLLFGAWATLISFLAPELFPGMTVLTPDRGPSQLIPGVFATSNFAQIIYLFLGICVVFFLARSPSAQPSIIGLAAGLTTALSLWRYLNQLVGLPFPEGVFDNSPTFAFIETEAGGAPRFRGILSEPAGIAGSSLVTMAYMMPRSLHARGWRRWICLVLAIAAAFMGAISTSGTFVAAGVAIAVVAAGTFIGRASMLRLRLRPVSVVVGCVAVAVSVWVLPLVATFVETTVNSKVGSASYGTRSGADAVSYDIVLDTFGLGVGLGSHRASSFAAGLLSTTGLIGTVLFAAVVAVLIAKTMKVVACRPVIWSLVALLITKVVSGPDLNDSSGILWMSIGVLTHAARERSAQAEPDAGSHPLSRLSAPRRATGT